MSALERQKYAMRMITKYGGYDGAHHKNWVIDQVARILLETPIIEDGLDFNTGEPSKKYLDWVNSLLGEKIDGEYEYGYDEGMPP